MNYFIDEYDKNKLAKVYHDLVQVQGGDGTLLKAINKFRHHELPFFGVAGGTVNFLMNESATISPNAKTKTFRLIKATITTDTGTKEYQAFNDIFISEENGWIDFKTEDKDNILGNFKGSGLIFSTPQGSTGINKNNSGVILPLSSKSWSITGDKTSRKINYVLSYGKIKINLESRGEIKVFLDGKNTIVNNVKSLVIEKGDKIDIIFNDYKTFKQKRII